MSGEFTAAAQLAELRVEHGRAPRLGCSLVAHRDLGFCAACHRTHGAEGELTAWRLLAMVERGVPKQLGET